MKIISEIAGLKEELKREISENKKQHKLIEHLEKMVFNIQKAVSEEISINTKQGFLMADFSHKQNEEHENIRQIRKLLDEMYNKESETYKKINEIVEKAMLQNHQKATKDSAFTQLQKDLFYVISLDHSLQNPHRKILNFLVTRYNDQSREFKWSIQNEIIRNAKLGLPFYKKYLNELLGKNLIEHRTEGKYIYYRIHPNFLRNEIKPVEQSLKQDAA